MSQQAEYDPVEYQARLTEFANRLALKRPDLNLLSGHPREEFPVITETLEYLLKERNAQLVLPNLAAFNNDAVGIFSDYSGENSGSYMTYLPHLREHRIHYVQVPRAGHLESDGITVLSVMREPEA